MRETRRDKGEETNLLIQDQKTKNIRKTKLANKQGTHSKCSPCCDPSHRRLRCLVVVRHGGQRQLLTLFVCPMVNADYGERGGERGDERVTERTG